MNRKLILGACAVALAAVFIVGPTVLADLQGKSTTSSNAADAKKTVSTSDTVYSVRVEKVVKKNLRSYIDVNGDIVAQISVAVVPDAAGKLVTLKVEVGSVVKKGQLIAEVDPSKPGIAYSLSPIYAPISGTVSSAPLSVGATVSTSTTVAVVGVMDKLEVEAKIPERDVGQLRNGLEAQLSLEAFPGEKFAAVVDRMSPVVDSTSRSKKIVLKFAQNDPRLNAGMFARVKLYTVTYINRVAVPEEAVVALRGNHYAYVLKTGETVAQREIKTGVTVDGMTEIIEGVAEGESVVTQGQQLLSDGAKVRVVNKTGSKA